MDEIGRSAVVPCTNRCTIRVIFAVEMTFFWYIDFYVLFYTENIPTYVVGTQTYCVVFTNKTIVVCTFTNHSIAALIPSAS